MASGKRRISKRGMRTKESVTRKKIDVWLINLGWNTDEEDPGCNVTTERAKTERQNKRLKGNEPDYVLYKSGTTQVLGIIEAKRKGKDLEAMLQESIEKYAEPLNAPLIFLTDGTFVISWHVAMKKELTIDEEPVTEFLPERLLLRFLEEGTDITRESKVIAQSREQLMEVFRWANDILRKEGIREGFDRFIEFANLLFLKLISEMELDREKDGEERILEAKFCWESFADLSPDSMLEYINGVVLPHLVARYNRSGDVFQSKLEIRTPKTLKEIVKKLSKLSLIDAESDIKGDAFEYFLKNSVTVGNDLGEYFTPRHIVKLMVDLANPRFGDKIYDPTCGTGGFLIQAFNHIRRTCTLTPKTLRILKNETVFGRELTNTSRIAKMNMVITGDGHTNIRQMDSLEHPVKDEYDVVLANLPYGQTTDWGDCYPIPSLQADSIFVQHIMESLKNGGRATVIVPEGFLFRPGADQKTRKRLLENFNLVAVISLPQGIFNPYTESKTNIIVFEKGSQTKDVWFYDLQHDGFDLGKLRRPIEKNDIPDLKGKWPEKMESENSWTASLERIRGNECELLVTSYRPPESDSGIERIRFSRFLSPSNERIKIDDKAKYRQITVQWYGRGAVLRREILGKDMASKTQYLARSGDVIVSKIDAQKGALAVVPNELDESVVSSDFPLFKVYYPVINRDYLDYSLRYGDFLKTLRKRSKGTTKRQRIKIQDVMDLELYLPSLDEQERIAERVGKQHRIIEDVEKTIDHLKDGIVDVSDFEGDFPLRSLEEVCKEIRGGGTPPRKKPGYFKGEIPWVKIGDYEELSYVLDTEEKITQEAIQDSSASLLPKDTVIVSVYATIGSTGILGISATTNQAIVGLVPKDEVVLPEYLMYYLHTQKTYLNQKGRGVTQKNINQRILKSIKVPIPTLKTQKEIIEKIAERKRMISELENAKKRASDVIYRIMKDIGMQESGRTIGRATKTSRLNDFE